jgi:hypothetical protein
MQLPDGFHEIDIVTESRPEDSLTWSEDEVLARWKESKRFGSESETITCGYCGSAHRFWLKRSNPRLAVAWFHEHPCGASTEATIEPTAPERVPQPIAA